MIHFDMNHSELLSKLKDELDPEQGFAYNKATVARQRCLWEAAQLFNIQPVIVSSRKETPLEREYPPIPPSTKSEKDNSRINYFPISEFKIGLQDLLNRKKK